MAAGSSQRPEAEAASSDAPAATWDNLGPGSGTITGFALKQVMEELLIVSAFLPD